MPSPMLVLVDQRDPAQDDTVGLQPLDPLPARRRRQADAVTDLGDRQRCVFLQHGQDLAVDGIEAAVGLGDLDGSIGDLKNFASYEGVNTLIYRKFF